MGHEGENKPKYGAKVGPKGPQGVPKWATKAKIGQNLVPKWSPKGPNGTQRVPKWTPQGEKKDK